MSGEAPEMMPVSKPNSMPAQRAEREDERAVERETCGNATPHLPLDGVDRRADLMDAGFHRTFGVVYWIGRLHRSHDSTFHSHRSSSI